MIRVNIYNYPIGKLRVQPVGIIICWKQCKDSQKNKSQTADNLLSIADFTKSIAGFIVLIQDVQELFKDESSERMDRPQLVWWYSIMLSATTVKLSLWFYCRSSPNEIVRAYAKGHSSDVFINLTGLVAAILGDRLYWWIDPLGAFSLDVYTIVNWYGPVLENAVSLVGQSAPPEVFQKLTYLVIRHNPLIKCVRKIQVYTVGVLYFVEVDIELHEELLAKEIHNICASLQKTIEELP
ncbi:hypothetical protein MKX03_013042 [Papaver bracteatum]|nr:hypothetical protein MKX03_013042 [Papaver bracteatum]